MMRGGNWLAGSKDDNKVTYVLYGDTQISFYSTWDKDNKCEKLLSDIIVTYKS